MKPYAGDYDNNNLYKKFLLPVKSMNKRELKIKSKNGRDSVVHYVLDNNTGQRMDFKFKKHSTDDIKPWGNDPSMPPGEKK